MGPQPACTTSGPECSPVRAGLGKKACADIREALDRGGYVAVDVEFRGWTPAGELRHWVFKGWHEG